MKSLLIVSTLLLSSPAIGVAQAKPIDMTQPIVDDDGKPLKDVASHERMEVDKDGKQIDRDPYCDKCKDLTIGTVIYRALTIVDERKEGTVLPEDKEAWHDLGKRILHAPAITLTPEETTVVKQRLDKAGYSGLVTEEIKAAIDPTYEPPKIKAK